MAEKWKVKTQTASEKIRGLASVKVSKDKVKVKFADNPEEVFECTKENAPSTVKSGDWWVSMSVDGERMFTINPVQGAFRAKFVKLASAEGQLPAPQHFRKEGVDQKTGKTYVSEYDYFLPVFEILDGEDEDAQGMSLTKFLRYYFAEENGEVTFSKNPVKSAPQRDLIDFLEVMGVFEKGPMKYSENILPALEKRIKEADRTVMLIIKEGNIQSMTPLVNKKKSAPVEEPEEEKAPEVEEKEEEEPLW